jgi:hypothetical protein
VASLLVAALPLLPDPRTRSIDDDDDGQISRPQLPAS